MLGISQCTGSEGISSSGAYIFFVSIICNGYLCASLFIKFPQIFLIKFNVHKLLLFHLQLSVK